MIQPLTEYPLLEDALRGSLTDFDMLEILPRVSVEVVREYSLRKGQRRTIEVCMWDFVLVHHDDKWLPLPVEIGKFEQDLGDDAPDDASLKFRIVRTVLDGSAEKWAALMNVLMPRLN